MHQAVSFSGVALSLIGKLGVAGVGLGVFLNGIGIPGLGETLLPLGGVAVRQGQMNLAALLVVAMAAQLLGLTCAYFIARYGGVALVERYGKYVMLSTHELHKAQRGFDRFGSALVLFGSFIPGPQSIIGYAAGLAEMDYWKFLASAAVGKLVWVGGLVAVGVVLGNNLDLIDRSIKQIGVIVLAGLVVLVAWYLYSHRRAASRSVAGKETES